MIERDSGGSGSEYEDISKQYDDASKEERFFRNAQQKKMHELWKIHFECVTSDDREWGTEEAFMFYNHLGWLGLNGHIDPRDVEATGFYAAAVDFVERYAEQVGESAVREELSTLLEFLWEGWGENEVPISRSPGGLNNLDATDGEINGSLSTD